MHQHWVPASYLRAWYDPASLHLQDPYVWRFSKDGSEVRKKSPRNLFRESEMYTLTDENGQPSLTIERGLSRLESQFESLRRDKILYCEALTDEDKATLFLFVATAHFRTQRSQNHWREQWGQAVEMGENIAEHIRSLSPEERAALQTPSPASGPSFSQDEVRLLADPVRMLPLVTNREAQLLSEMNLTIFCTRDNAPFITSDAPVVWHDPELYKMPPFYRHVAWGSPTVQVTMPLAPTRLLLLTHEGFAEGYTPILPTLNTGMQMVDDWNRRTRFHCDDHFVSNSGEKKDIWFDPGSPPAS
jgi:hypothetical protein